MIRAICFDLDGVYFTEDGKQGFFDDLVEIVGDKEKVTHFLYRSQQMSMLCSGKITPKKFRQWGKEYLGVNRSLEEFSQNRIKHYRIDQKVHHLIEQLKNNNYLICTCTNNNPIRIQALEEDFGFGKNFDIFISSHNVGVFKPDRKIFEILIQKTGVLPEEIVYTDDRDDKLTGARELGIHTYCYDSLRGYIQFLRSLGVGW